MHAMLDFTRAMLRMPVPWLSWIGLLLLANLGGGLVYLANLEGRVVTATFLLAAILLMAIYARLGFVRLLGLGHVVWLPLVAWLLTRLDAAPPEGFFRAWLWAVIVLNSLSLLIDAVDVVRYLRGERAPTVPR